jgi:hypothetical protein
MASSQLRSCWNIQSKKHPDVKCKRTAVFGDFCSLHYKNPTRFKKKSSIEHISNKHISLLQRFQKKSRVFLGLKAFESQGPATYLPEIATNDTEIATLDPVHSIPRVYRFSFKEGVSQIWLFDIRSLLAEKVRAGIPFKNPYTGVMLSEKTLFTLQSRINWLHRRGYLLEYSLEDTGQNTETHQVVQLCLFIDAHGYLTNTQWFENLSLEDIKTFLTYLEELWEYRLGLTISQKREIIPSWNPSQSLTPNIRSQSRISAFKQFIQFLLRFVQSSEVKETRTLLCMYILISLCNVSHNCRQTYPWLS